MSRGPLDNGDGDRKPQQPPWVVIIIVVIMAPGLVPGWSPELVRQMLTILIPLLVSAMALGAARRSA
jgi:hypothetical protein